MKRVLLSFAVLILVAGGCSVRRTGDPTADWFVGIESSRSGMIEHHVLTRIATHIRTLGRPGPGHLFRLDDVRAASDVRRGAPVRLAGKPIGYVERVWPAPAGAALILVEPRDRLRQLLHLCCDLSTEGIVPTLREGQGVVVSHFRGPRSHGTAATVALVEGPWALLFRDQPGDYYGGRFGLRGRCDLFLSEGPLFDAARTRSGTEVVRGVGACIGQVVCNIPMAMLARTDREPAAIMLEKAVDAGSPVPYRLACVTTPPALVLDGVRAFVARAWPAVGEMGEAAWNVGWRFDDGLSWEEARLTGGPRAVRAELTKRLVEAIRANDDGPAVLRVRVTAQR